MRKHKAISTCFYCKHGFREGTKQSAHALTKNVDFREGTKLPECALTIKMDFRKEDKKKVLQGGRQKAYSTIHNCYSSGVLRSKNLNKRTFYNERRSHNTVAKEACREPTTYLTTDRDLMSRVVIIIDSLIKRRP